MHDEPSAESRYSLSRPCRFHRASHVVPNPAVPNPAVPNSAEPNSAEPNGAEANGAEANGAVPGPALALRQSSETRPRLAGVRFDPLTLDQTVRKVIEGAVNGQGGILATPNVDHLALVRAGIYDEKLLEKADLVVADGMPIVWASRILASRCGVQALPERVAGADLLPSICASAARAGVPVAFVGAREGAGRRAAERLSECYPGLVVCAVICPPVGFEHSETQRKMLLEQLLETRPRIVFTALGAPKQEEVNSWLSEWLPEAWLVGCGASVDFQAGLVKRAPVAVQKVGAEWLWRMAQEPRRLAKRYVYRDFPMALRLFAYALAGRDCSNNTEFPGGADSTAGGSPRKIGRHRAVGRRYLANRVRDK